MKMYARKTVEHAVQFCRALQNDEKSKTSNREPLRLLRRFTVEKFGNIAGNILSK